MKKEIVILISLLLWLASYQKQRTDTIDLSGEWQFRMDPEDRGVGEEWFVKELPETVLLPGSMAENGKGNDVTLRTKWTGGINNAQWYDDPDYAPYVDSANVRFPFWLQPEKEYTGAAWYRKEISIPDDWLHKTVLLTLERPHWETTVWINGKKAGMQNSLAVPHLFDVTSFVQRGNNVITICVDNRTKDIDVGENSHSISDHTQSNWNGIVGEISLRATGKILFDEVAAFPNVENKSLTIKAVVNNQLSELRSVEFLANVLSKNGNGKGKSKRWKFDISPGENVVEMILDLEKMPFYGMSSTRMYTNCFLLLLQIRSRIPVPLILDCVSSGQKVPVLLSTDDRFFCVEHWSAPFFLKRVILLPILTTGRKYTEP
jgi:hypothetical protein